MTDERIEQFDPKRPELGWHEAAPLPFQHGFFERCGRCGKTFWLRGKRARYQRHWRETHGGKL